MTGPGSNAPSSGEVLADARWVGRHVQRLLAAWECPDTRIAGTLWWYMASSTLLAEPMRHWVTAQTNVDPSPAQLTLTTRGDGTVAHVEFGATVPQSRFPDVLATMLTTVVATVAAGSDAHAPSLWAVTADAIANRAVDADREHGPPAAVDLARLLPDSLPTPRFVAVGGQVFVRRASCCLLYETGKADKCISCPRRAPEDREGLLRELVRRGR